MSKFCGNCGNPLNEGAGFCGSCGASTQRAAGAGPVVAAPSPAPTSAPVPTPAAFQPVGGVFATAGAGTSAPVAVGGGKNSNPWVKVVIAVSILFVACGAMAVGVVVYVAHKVSQKAHDYSAKILGVSDATAPSQSLATRVAGMEPSGKDADSGASTSGYAGDACALLSKEDVGHAIGVSIVSTQSADSGCSYLAAGTGADMAAKHAAAMVGARGVDKKTQGMVEQFAGGLLKNVPKDAKDNSQIPDGTVVVFNFSIDGNSAKEQLQLNHKVLGNLGGGAQQDLDGIGDEAFVEADSMMLVRKGDKLIRIMFAGCPCATDAIKPLAKELASKL